MVSKLIAEFAKEKSLCYKMYMASQLPQNHIEDTVKVMIGGLVGFSFFLLISHPKSSINKKIPHKNIKNFTVLPSVQFHTKQKTYHFHHWLNLASLYLVMLTKRKKLLKSKIIHGFMIGSILQGLSYRDAFKMRYKRSFAEPATEFRE